MKQKIIYYFRWILSAFVMMPLMIVLEWAGLPLWINLLLGQSMGAAVFWHVDRWIFKGV